MFVNTVSKQSQSICQRCISERLVKVVDCEHHYWHAQYFAWMILLCVLIIVSLDGFAQHYWLVTLLCHSFRTWLSSSLNTLLLLTLDTLVLVLVLCHSRQTSVNITSPLCQFHVIPDKPFINVMSPPLYNILLPPPQIGLMKDTLFVDMFCWDHKKVNEEEMRTNNVHTMQFHEESMISGTNAARRLFISMPLLNPM